MITGMHTMMYSPKADAVRAFFRDVLGFSHVDAGHGWLIFKGPPAELAAHPSEGEDSDDLDQTLAELTAKGATCGPVADAGWGKTSAIRLPDGSDLMIYEPRYQTAI